uniref:Polymerase nucleotidyl transferase domain-containing protein n=1 Tax=Chromera velia CCMP2878 TaxID=1169474 RepID=A0A0G4GIJ5_9ALVE|mmetsp:Transcript_32992/g.65341  ORF Transcript_32992/g.65341 Transcript_32992/m.65341 type:complete len:171 (-) Transcript_32992:52-564(-)|eukprot:Cvel_4753.t1-p1 / transcript=Cvel_4753.t1 / gene=Cvel_4753 / organism=Chromera_velia_CCMP2878 / gene_product=hypothetical protein / transcript_product=hypothetical protein / location=Cvel_scaffold212:14930-15439(-) / protein_length=170 / sequence_SO=supercontig / SO=protein_coding / is_pseudo=false
MTFLLDSFSFDLFVHAPPEEKVRRFDQLVQKVERGEGIVEEVAGSFRGLLKKHGVKMHQHGSWTQRIALPDSDVDISCPEDGNLVATRRALESKENRRFEVESAISEWRILVRDRKTKVLLDVTQKAAHSTEPYWKAEHIRRSINWAVDDNVRMAILLLKPWVRKHEQTF